MQVETDFFPMLTAGPAAPESSLADQATLKQAAEDFEAAYISQMLTFSGLAEALSSGDGKKADAFTGFYIEKIAQSISAQGGFGLAEQVYQHLLKSYNAKEESSVTSIRL